MNERIQELAEQATTIVENKNPQTDFTSSYANFDREKFAELIIKDIVTIMNDPKNYSRCTYTNFDLDRAMCVSSELVKIINETFGTKI